MKEEEAAELRMSERWASWRMMPEVTVSLSRRPCGRLPRKPLLANRAPRTTPRRATEMLTDFAVAADLFLQAGQGSQDPKETLPMTR